MPMTPATNSPISMASEDSSITWITRVNADDQSWLGPREQIDTS
jgi:hypothetical protein